MTPSAGVSAHSAEFTEMTFEAFVVPGATVANPPWLIALEHALNFADPLTIAAAVHEIEARRAIREARL